MPSSTSTSSTPETATPAGSGSGGKDDDDTVNNSQLGPGVIAGIIVGVLVILSLLATVVVLLRRRRRRRHTHAVTERPEIDPYSPHGMRAASPGYSPLGGTTTSRSLGGESKCSHLDVHEKVNQFFISLISNNYLGHHCQLPRLGTTPAKSTVSIFCCKHLHI